MVGFASPAAARAVARALECGAIALEPFAAGDADAGALRACDDIVAMPAGVRKGGGGGWLRAVALMFALGTAAAAGRGALETALGPVLTTAGAVANDARSATTDGPETRPAGEPVEKTPAAEGTRDL